MRGARASALALLPLALAIVVGVVVNGRDMPTVGAEVAREARRASWALPKVSNWLAERALRSKLLDVPA